MKTSSYIIFLVIILTSSELFPQLDSVYYKGPSQGSVSNGATQTTDNFSADMPAISREGKKVSQPIPGKHNNKDMIFKWDKSRLPEYRYVEDTQVINKNSANSEQPVLLDSFPGISMTNYIPPDPVIAAGPNHIIVCANSLFKIMDKNGNVLKNISAVSWWAPVSPDESGDPQVIYDHYAGRWVLVWMQVNSGNLTSANLIAYSDNDNPLGTWYMYRLDTKMHGTVPSSTWGDYPHIGFDEEAFYISTGCTDFAGGGHRYNKIRIISKSDLYNSNAGPLTYTDIWELHVPGQGSASDTIDYIQPGISYTPGNGGWLLWANGVYNGAQVSADYYVIYKVLNPLISPVIKGKVLPVQTYTSPPLSQHWAVGLGIVTIRSTTRQPVMRDQFLYASHDIQNSTNSAYSSIKYLKIDLNTVSIIDNIEFGSAGYFYLFPALTIDQDHNAVITYSRSADNEYIGAYFSAKYANELVIRPSHPIIEGQGNYEITYGGNLNRWGDYFGIYLDPANNYDFWTITEYAKVNNTWDTYVGRIRMAAYPGAYAYAESFTVDFKDLEVGSPPATKIVTLSNYGEDDLVIDTITSLVGPFSLLTNFTLPLTIVPYDSIDLEFEFNPTDPIHYDEVMAFTNNDPNFPGFTMKGRGYEINEAGSGYFYSTSGKDATGKTLLVNKTDGSGMELGPTEYESINTITVDPKTNFMYGVSSGTPQSNLLRINGTGGDTHTYYALDLSFAVAVACDTNGVLYVGLQGGEIHSVDLSTGNTTLVTTANIQLVSLAVNPVTNEMWASPRVVIGQKDKIYKIDLSTGVATLIGETDFNVTTNDLAFDESGTLYGVIGAATEEGQLISINTTTALGTLVGDIGFNNVKGLAYAVYGIPLSADDEYNNSIPLEFALEQNYPNPFNPSTNIKYQLADYGQVTLKVYDVLGNEVMTLVNEQKPAGSYEVEFNASSLTSGVYFYQLTSGSLVQTKKMVLLK